MDNKYVDFDDKIRIFGLTLPDECYVKGHLFPLEKSYIEDKIGKANYQKMQLMMAHNPSYSELYANFEFYVLFGVLYLVDIILKLRKREFSPEFLDVFSLVFGIEVLANGILTPIFFRIFDMFGNLILLRPEELD